jgi:hypothetical protein
MSLACITLLAESVGRNCHSFRKSQHKAIRYHLLPQRHSSPCDAEGREHREWEKDYHEVTANHIVSAGESDKTQHFCLPFRTLNLPTMPTYKKEYPTLVEDIMTDCDIYSADGHKFHTERALWDTGADTTIISSRIVTELALQPYKAGGISGIGGATGSNV